MHKLYNIGYCEWSGRGIVGNPATEGYSTTLEGESSLIHGHTHKLSFKCAANLIFVILKTLQFPSGNVHMTKRRCFLSIRTIRICHSQEWGISQRFKSQISIEWCLNFKLFAKDKQQCSLEVFTTLMSKKKLINQFLNCNRSPFVTIMIQFYLYK